AGPRRGKAESDAGHPRMIGIVTAIEGSRVTGIVRAAPSDSAGQSVEAPAYGAPGTIKGPASTIFGSVSRIALNMSQNAAEIELEILGEIGARGQFQRGISAYPRLGAPIMAATQEEVAEVYAVPGTASVRVGSLHQD